MLRGRSSTRLSKSESTNSDIANAASSARRRRSRSPLRAVSKRGSKIVGILTRSKSTKQHTSKQNAAVTRAAVLDVANKTEKEGKKEKAFTPTSPEHDYEEDTTVYGVELDSVSAAAHPSAAESALAQPTSSTATTSKSQDKISKETEPNKSTTSKETISEKTTSAAKQTSTTAPTHKNTTGGSDEVAHSGTLPVVLLLMDPATRRFELLQLEFEGGTALVKDIFAQIPLSATEEGLRIQEYVAICDAKGEKFDLNSKLHDHARKNDVVVAVPKGMTEKECSKLAKPILGDPKVGSMLNAEATPPPHTGENKKKTAQPKSSKDQNKPEEENKRAVTTTGGSRTFVYVLLVTLLAPVMIKYQLCITAPLKPGDFLPLGSYKSKCGLLSPFPEDRTECTPSVLEMGSDGVLKLTEGGDLIWKVEGKVCAEKDKNCVDGLVVEQDGSVSIGGAHVKFSHDQIKDSSTWPFANNPRKPKRVRN